MPGASSPWRSAPSLARALVVFGMLPVLEKTHLVQPVDKRYKAILVWGGLRGAVTIVLAMVAAGDQRLPENVREFIALSATLFVLFTLFVNATTLGLIMHVLGLDKLSRLELALRDRVLALSRVNVARHLQQIMRQHNARVEGIDVDPASAGEAEIESAPAELALDLDERVKVGLVTLCTREKELYLELFEQQILSRRMVAVLAARADRLIDTVRDQGVAGYEEWLHDISLPDLGFRVALWLHRRLGFARLLTESLADRFEILMVSQSVLAELAAFNISSVADLLGPDAEVAARRGHRKPSAGRRQRAQGAVAAVSGLRRIDRGAPARARRHPLRVGGVRPAPAAKASSAARSTTTCASSSPSGAAPSASARRSISASNWPA